MLHHRTSKHCILLASFNERIGSKNLTNQNCCKAVNIADTHIHWWLMAVKTSKALCTIHPKMTRHMAVETSCFICAKQYQASHGVNANVCPGQQRRKVRNKIGLKANICHHHYLSRLRNIFSIIPNSSRLFRDQCQLHGVYRYISPLTIAPIPTNLHTENWCKQHRPESSLHRWWVLNHLRISFVTQPKQQEMLSKPALFWHHHHV